MSHRLSRTAGLVGWRPIRIALALAAAMAGGGLTLAEASTQPPRCFGQAATITGSGTINGTAGADVIVGSSGADVIDGLGGDDLICGLNGDDQLIGGPGNDKLDGGAGDESAGAGMTGDSFASSGDMNAPVGDD